jgi:spore maturation protein CgeB
MSGNVSGKGATDSGGRRNLRILVHGSDITAPFLVLAFRQLGHFVATDIGAFGSCVPDWILGVNEKERTVELSETYGIPRMIWFSDLHADIFEEPRPSSCELCGDREFFFCFSPQQADWFRSAGAKHVSYLPPAADPNFFRPNDGVQGQFKAVLSFMGEVRIGTQNEMRNLLDDITKTRSEAEASALHSFLEGFLDPFSTDLTPIHPVRLAAQMAKNAPVALQPLLAAIPQRRWARAIENALNAAQRISLCRAIEEQGLKIWGTLSDWELAGTWTCHAGRRADFLREWPEIVAGSTACLNLFRPAVWHGVPQKVFEIAAAGSLVLTNNHPNLHDVLVPGVECLTFQSVAECREKLEWIRKNPAEAGKIASAGRRRILVEHSYLHRASTFVATMERYRLPGHE